jgi:predicted PurR-regulated permease PerM
MSRSDSAPSPLLRTTLSWVVVAAIVGVLFYLLAPVLTPFLIAAIIGYILNPGVDWLARHRVPRWLGTTLMLILLIACVILLILIVVPVLQREFLQAQRKLPDLLNRMQTGLAPKLSSLLGVDVEFSAEAIRGYVADHFNFEKIGASALAYLRVGSAAALSWLATAFLVPIVLFYLLIDWHMVWSRMQALIPRGLHTRLGTMTGEVDRVLAQFLRGQLLVMLVLAVYYTIALSVARFDGALPIGLVTGLLVFIPYVGFASGLVLALLAALLQFGSLYGFAAVAVIYGLGQILESVILTPRLVGTNIGLHPLAVIFALLAFGELFGFFGILLALPVSAVLVVALKHFKVRYLASDFYRGRIPDVHASTDGATIAVDNAGVATKI